MRRRRTISNKISYIKPIDGMILIVVFFMFVFLIVGMYTGTERYKEGQVLLVQDSMDVLADNQKVEFEQYIGNKVTIYQEADSECELIKEALGEIKVKICCANEKEYVKSQEK